ncbi:MAG: GNAT family N-acetyltransferase, partial [Actinobacteria bacterium]
YATCGAHGATATLGRLAVSPEARGRGIGAALVAEAARWSAGVGCETLSLCTQSTNEASRALYARLGFVEASERYVLGTRDA